MSASLEDFGLAVLRLKAIVVANINSQCEDRVVARQSTAITVAVTWTALPTSLSTGWSSFAFANYNAVRLWALRGLVAPWPLDVKMAHG